MSEAPSPNRDSKFEDAVRAICRKDSRYHPQAYFFVREALEFTARKLRRAARRPARHVTGPELLEGIRQFALREFGPMALAVLNEWGVHRTEDIGGIVFRLIEAGRLGRAETDRLEDFAGGYDFREAFEYPFLPPSRRPARRAGRRGPPRRKPEA